MSDGPLGNEHPFIDIRAVKDQLTIEEIQGKLKEIIERLNFAYRTGNQPLINQLNMARATYSRAQQEKLAEMFGDDKNKADIDGKIDIS